jgi:hypothetical protein
MRTITITFVDHGLGTEARQATTILASALMAQGRHPQQDAQSVTFTTNNPGPAQVLVLLDEALLHEPVILNAVDSDTAVVLCSARPAKVVLDEMGRPAARLATVDAEGIADEEGTDPVIALLGGAARMVPEICIERLTASVWNAYDRDFAYGARAAARALDLGYTLTQEWRAAF